MASDSKKMQKHVLETVERFGLLYPGNQDAWAAVDSAGYGMEEYSLCCRALIHDGYLVPATEERNNESGPSDRFPECLSVKGQNYLYELQHPILVWLKRNWFAAMIAGATIVASLAGPAAALAIALWIVD